MTRIYRVQQWLSEMVESMDRAFMASALSQAGEPELAREVMREGRRSED